MSIPLTPLLVSQGVPLLAAMRGARTQAEFVNDVGYWLHFDHEGDAASWPFALDSGFRDMVRLATKGGAICEEPKVGDIAIVCKRGSYPKRPLYTHGGFVIKLNGAGQLGKRGPSYRDVLTLEAAAPVVGAADRCRIVRISRRIIAGAGDCFIRWSDLDARAARAGVIRVA